MKNDVVRWTTSSLTSPHNSANMTVIETASARTKVSNSSSSIVKHHKSPRRRNLSLSTLSSVTSYNSTTPLTTTIMTSTSTTTNKINRKILNNYCDNSTQLGVSKSTTNNNNNETSSKNVWRQSTGRHTLDLERMRSRSSTIFMRPRAFFVDKRTDFTKFLVLCLQISVVLCLCSSNVGVVADDSELEANPSTPGGHFTHTWAVHVPNGEEEGLADRVASDHGFINLGKIFGDHYHFEHSRLTKRSVLPSDHHQKRLDDDDRVHWAKQQIAKRRQKRDFIRMRPSRTSSRSLSLVDSMQFSDPKWPQMWYLNRGGGLDMNVIPAWKEGITGKGVVVTILDDGLESDHPDIDANFDPQASYDVNGHDPDPMPHYDMTDSNRHGTRCAGEVAATANNSICAVGIAYGASVGGVRMLDGDVTDAVEARSLSLNPQHIDIYSASWGPDDDGKTVDGPGELASRAFIEGVTKGRNGKGSIFIWASGNGGRELDNCNCDGYTNSIWTLSISSATEEGHVPWYSEKCSSTLATTYSSGGQSEKQVVTTDLHHSCTVSHTGTSASAPLAAGIAALVLESNSNLTWRDLQHIVVRTAKPANLKDSTWSKNGVGRRISHSFGYGLMDAAAMVQLARNWKTVPEQQRCEINAPHVDKIIPAKGYITLQLTVKHCLSVNYLEHVQAKITLTSHRRGDIQLYLKSPAGTKVTLLTSRVHDVSRSGFSQWPFMSVHTWGESPHGNWQLEIHNEGRYMVSHALLREWSLIFYGTTLPIDPNDPVSMRTNPSEDTTTSSSSSSSSQSSSQSSSTSTNLHQIYSPQYPRMPATNFNSFATQSKLNAKVSSMKAANGTTVLLGGPGNNKKQQQQQQYHQVSATYGVILGSAKNKSKNGKNGNSGGNGGNGGGKNKGSKSSNRPGNTQQQQQQSSASSSISKNNFFRIPASNGKSSSSKQTSGSTQRPKMSQQANYNSNGAVVIPNSKSVASDKSIQSVGQTMTAAKLPIKAPKQVKDNNAYNGNSGISGVGGGIGGSSIATTSSKSAAVSSSGGTLSSSSSSTSLLSMPQKTNHRIPKLFEHYEKIQQIFPEFHPYMGTAAAAAAAGLVSGQKDATSSLPSLSSSLSLSPSSSLASGASTSTLSLSSSITRQGSNRKQFQFYDPSVGVGLSGSSSSGPLLSSSSSGVGNGRGSVAIANPKPSRENSKKSSPSTNAGYQLQQEYQLTPKQLSSSHQQQQQQARPPPPARTATQRPGEKIYLPNRKSTNAQITQWDLIFYGTESPAQPDDPVQISPGQFGSSFGGDMEHNLLEYDPDTASGQWRNVQQVGESLADIQHENDQTSSACMRITLDQRCIECKDPTYLFNGKCYTKCPEQTFAISEVLPTEHDALFNDLDEIQKHMKTRSTLDEALLDDGSLKNMCAICDKSCLHCSGPSPAQCTACFPESRLKTVNNLEGFCFVFAERSSGDDKTESKSNWKYVPAVFLLFFIPPMVIVVIVAVSMIVRKRFTSKKDYMYNRVAFNIANEETRALTAEEEEEANADQSNSDKFKSEDLIIPNREQSIPRYKLVVDSESSDSEEDILNLSKT
ncbi:furin-like protease 1 [Episyrphus balteatus]|uniref:furin-like protease 1 n=1 Tax=Episyrphus balteatus TaxID=286459 RepID=UPI002486B3A2|nr:furin-like protease 1 [Episyrphus balteatus]XP_055850088.1 furin-like protease 1 [Episyrphus balteatus]XP_055850089.1 furin-like protease 1 [Episyrphus balteatus]XP_055850091.1 furin-like protease 1 [Episyrphus balteatus]XP_055850092.1 furin-like protease 1 [Episyrphus balteatus]XP_055850093.1 furin-like protease 1 [Episyrphus balteatus]